MTYHRNEENPMRLWMRVPFTPFGVSFGGRRRYRPTEGNAALGYVVLIALFCLLVAAVVANWAQLWPWLLAVVVGLFGYVFLKAYRHPDTVDNTTEDRQAKVKACPPCAEAVARARKSGGWERCRRCRTPWRIRKPAATPNQASVSDRR
jgi:ribosomal protein L37AE/L43A